METNKYHGGLIMFDKTILLPTRTETRYVQTCPEKVQIDINSAPTDESVRMLRELEDAAEKNIVMKISENFNNRLHVEFIVLKEAIAPLCTLYIRATVNGKVYQRKVRTTENPHQMLMAVRHGEMLSERLMKYLYMQTVLLVSEILLGQRDFIDALTAAVQKLERSGDFNFQSLTDKLEEGEFDNVKFIVEHYGK